MPGRRAFALQLRLYHVAATFVHLSNREDVSECQVMSRPRRLVGRWGRWVLVVCGGAAFVNVQAAPAVAFQVIAPASATSGTPFDVTVIAVDPYANTDTNYTGTVTFSTSDGDTGVMLPPDDTFQPSDAGMATFPGGVTLITGGDQTLTATDTQSGITAPAR
jgi:hypothetical protein